MARSHADKHKQSRLTFSPLPSSSPARASQPEAVRHRAAAITLDMSPSKSKKRKLDDYYIPTPLQSSSQVRSSQAERAAPKMWSSPSSQYRKHNFMASSMEPVRARTNGRQRVSFSESDEEERVQQIPSSSSESSPEPEKQVPGNSPSDSDELPDLNTAIQNAKRQRRRKRGSKSDEDVVSSPVHQKKHKKAITIPDASDDDEVSARPHKIRASRASRRGTASSPAKRRKVVQISDDEDELGDGIGTRTVPAVHVEHNSDEVDNQEDEDSDDEPVSAHRRRLTRRRADRDSESPSKKSKTREDLDEDLEFLNDEDPFATRPSQTPRKTAKQQALEALRKKRSKQSASKVSSRAGRGGRPIVLSDDEDEEPLDEEEENDLPPSEDEDDLDLPSARATFSTRDDADADFIVDDEEDGADSNSHPIDLPMQFSRYASMPTADLFKYLVEWLVQKKINPAFAMSDDVYRISYSRLNDFVKGMGGSKFQSSIWGKSFSDELLARPGLIENHKSALEVLHGCDACNRSGHPATHEVRFVGPRYEKETLDEESESEDEDEDDEESSSDDDDNLDTTDKKQPSSKTFYLGKFCMANARSLHTLTHWRYHLNEWVIDYMKASGYLTSDLIVERDSWSTKKRRRYANDIVDAMEEDGEIKKLYKDFKREVSMAQKSNSGQYGGTGYMSP